MKRDMKAICIKPVRVDGCQFEKGKEYEFTEQVFTEEYNPGIHPLPGRGQRIRYIRYKATYVPPFSIEGPDSMVTVREVYLYDYSYYLHHDGHDERGHATECFDHFFRQTMPTNNRIIKPTKKQPYNRLPEIKPNDNVMEIPDDIIEYMKRNWQEQMYQMFGGLRPEDWDFDRFIELKAKKESKKI